jgi:hypothetical protein
VHKVRLLCYYVAQNPIFDWFIMAVILANTAALAASYYYMSPQWNDGLDGANTAFAVIFICEAVIKLLAFGPRQYFGVAWNRFDFTLVCGSILGWLLAVSPVITLLRIFRVARIFRMVRASRGLLTLFRTLILSLPALFNVGLVLCIVFFIFSIIGMNLFSGTRYSGPYNMDANFDSFWVSLLTLFRCSTGESWNEIMHSLRIQPPYCDPDPDKGNCGEPNLSPIFFIVSQLAVSFILVKLLVAMVMDTCGDLMELDKKAAAAFLVTPDTLDLYMDAWAEVDPTATKFLYLHGVLRLLSLLPHPLGSKNAPFSKGISAQKDAFLVLTQLSLSVPADHKFHFHTLLDKIVARAKRIQREESQDLGSSSPAVLSGGATRRLMALTPGGGQEYTIVQFAAAFRVQRAVRNRALNKAVSAARQARREARRAGAPPAGSP